MVVLRLMFPNQDWLGWVRLPNGHLLWEQQFPLVKHKNERPAVTVSPPLESYAFCSIRMSEGETSPAKKAFPPLALRYA